MLSFQYCILNRIFVDLKRVFYLFSLILDEKTLGTFREEVHFALTNILWYNSTENKVSANELRERKAE